MVACPGQVGGGDALRHVGEEGAELPAPQAVQQPFLLHNSQPQLAQALHHLHTSQVVLDTDNPLERLTVASDGLG